MLSCWFSRPWGRARCLSLFVSSSSGHSCASYSSPITTVLLLVLLGLVACHGANPKNYHVGAVLDLPDHVNQFHKIIDDINYEGEGLLPPGVTLHGHAIRKKQSAIEDTKNFCQNLMPNEVSAVIIDDREPSEAIAFTSSVHNIPTIGLTNRECIFSDKSLYSSYMRTSSSYSHQADVWVELLTHLDFECVHFIVSDSINGRNIKTRFIALADATNGFDIESTIEYNYLRPYIVPQLENILSMNASCRVFVLYADQENAQDLLRQVSGLNMSSTDNVWLVSEQALQAPNLPVGFLGVRYKDWDNVAGHIVDSVYVISYAIRQMHHQVNFTSPPTDCRNIGRHKWLNGEIFYDYLRDQMVIFGKTGKVSFDERGDRLNGEYEIMNQQYDRRDRLNKYATTLVNVGLRHYNKTRMRIEVDLQKSIIWPGNQTTKPVGYAYATHIKIATISEKPFVWVMPADRKGNCGDDQIQCPIRKKHPLTGEYFEEVHCCEGYCMDLLRALAAQMNFTYTLYQVEDGLYGSYSYNRKTGKHEWTGLLGELYYGRADMVMGALTITPERSMAIDFTKPFKYQGITILQKRQAIQRTRHPLTSFLQPFQDSLWVSVFVAVHVMALSLYLLDRFSPFGRYKLPNCETITEEDALNLSSAIWFAWGVLFNSGIGESAPRSFAGRVLGMIWASFAMIVVASYTANLAAFLVLDRPERALTGINDPRLRNPKEIFNYSTVRESSVELYFRRQVELAPVYKRMADILFDNVEDAIAAVKSGNLKAFIWDSSRLEYEAAKDCELSISGEHFGRSGYAIGLRKGSNTYWKDKVTLALLSMHEVGYMENLDNKWILMHQKICASKTESLPPTLGLKNMSGVFILLGSGILCGVGLIMFEIFYKQHQTHKQKRLELARNAVDKWKEMVENRKMLLESLNMAARHRYKERHQVHRRRQHLRNSSSKSYSDDKSLSMSSSETGPTSVHLSADSNNLRVCLNEGNGFTLHDMQPAQSGSSTVKKPTYLELKQTNSPAKSSSMTNSAPSMGSIRRADLCQLHQGELHPRANTRIYHQPQMMPTKPRLRREYSVSCDPTAESSMQPSSITDLAPYEQQPDLVHDHNTKRRSYGGNYVNIM